MRKELNLNRISILIFICIVNFNFISANFIQSVEYSSDGEQNRSKRQFDLTVDADHEEGIGTDLAASLNANLYKSDDGDTRLDGTARYTQHFSDYGAHGKAKVGVTLHLSHNY